jgi:hypothetical protein
VLDLRYPCAFVGYVEGKALKVQFNRLNSVLLELTFSVAEEDVVDVSVRLQR